MKILNKIDANFAIKVLVVEDEPTLTALYEKILRSADFPNFNVTSVHTFQDGLKQLEEERFHCLILDHELPDGRGLSLLPGLKKLPLDVRPAIIVITGHNDCKLALDYMKKGAHDFISKEGLRVESLPKTIISAIQKMDMEYTIEKLQESEKD